jgi:hypothetical protein
MRLFTLDLYIDSSLRGLDHYDGAPIALVGYEHP